MEVEEQVKDAEVVEPSDREPDESVYTVGELLELTEEQESKIKKRLKAEIKDWKQDTADLHNQLEDDQELLDGIMDDTDFPFEGCYQFDTGISDIYMGLYTNFLEQSSMGQGTLFSSQIEPGSEQKLTADVQAQVESMMNYKFFNEWNGRQGLTDGIFIACRDRLGAIQCTWLEEYKKTKDIIIIESPEAFDQEFPDAEQFDGDEDEFNEWKEKAQSATEQDPIEVPITFDKLVYRGNYYEAIERVNFVTFPATAVDIKPRFCRGYGKRYNLRRGIIRKKMNDGVWFEEACERILNKKQERKQSGYERMKDEIGGLRRTGKNKTDEIEFFEVVYRMELEEGEGERELLLTYAAEYNELVEAKDYPYKANEYMALIRIDKRPNQIDGRSVLDRTRQSHLQINETTNMRHNIRLIVNVPSFKAEDDLKQSYDPAAPENRFRPGMIAWLPKGRMDSLEQWKIQPTDLGESMNEDHNTLNLLDMRMGTSSALLSGSGGAKGSKKAPGAAQAQQQLQASFSRLSKPLGTVGEGIGDLGDISLSHLYQFGEPFITYEGQGSTQKLPKKILRSGIKMTMAATQVAHSPDQEFQKGMMEHQMYMSEPLFAQNAELRVEHMRMVAKRGRLKNVDKFLPPAQVIHQKQVQLMQEAIKQMQAQKAAMAEKAKQERLKKVKQALSIRDTSRKAAEESLDMPEPVGKGAST